MAFTAGSVELARANRLGNQLSHLFTSHGLAGAIGATGAKMIEKYAKKAGFGITGITTGSSFPPFGSFLPSYGFGVEAALQNPRGETMTANIALAPIQGQTVGIYIKKFVNDGRNYKTTVWKGITLAKALDVGANVVIANGGFTASMNDRLVFGPGQEVIVGFNGGAGFPVGGTTLAGQTAGISLASISTFSAATGAAFDIVAVGVTRGTLGVYGTTFEGYQSGTVLHGGFTACLSFTGPAGGSGSWTLS